MATYYRSDQAAIHLTVNGVSLDTTSWDSMEGGDNVAEETEHFPGGMRPQVPLGGQPKRSPLTVERKWSDVLIGIYKQLDESVNAEATASYVQLDLTGAATGEVITYTGLLSSTTRPNYKAGTSEDAMLKVTLSLNGEIS